ncbi:MAG: hypothetical protein U0989_03355 [Azonexus sp.]|nr:hypothetical protein [Azonexus sp.]
MVIDTHWFLPLSRRAEETTAKPLRDWLDNVRNLVIVEIGAGTAIVTVRRFDEGLGFPLIRINRQEHAVARLGDVGISMGGREALRRIADGLGLTDNVKNKPSQIST